MKNDISGERVTAPGELQAHPHLAGRLIPGGHELVLRVYYEDTDFSGIVYHANYLKFMERGRSDYMRLLGVVQGELFAEAAAEAPGFHFVVRSMQIDFFKPARIDDVLEVVTLSREVAGASIMLAQSVRRGRRDSGLRRCAGGVCLPGAGAAHSRCPAQGDAGGCRGGHRHALSRQWDGAWVPRSLRLTRKAQGNRTRGIKSAVLQCSDKAALTLLLCGVRVATGASPRPAAQVWTESTGQRPLTCRPGGVPRWGVPRAR